ncbi:hypothetical protein D3C75_1091800 [compost metagenome]
MGATFLITFDRLGLITKTLLPATWPLSGLLQLRELPLVWNVERIGIGPSLRRILRDDACIHQPGLHHLAVKLIELFGGFCKLWEPLLILCDLLCAIFRRPCQVIPEYLLAALSPGNSVLVQQIILEVHIDVFVFLH